MYKAEYKDSAITTIYISVLVVRFVSYRCSVTAKVLLKLNVFFSGETLLKFQFLKYQCEPMSPWAIGIACLEF